MSTTRLSNWTEHSKENTLSVDANGILFLFKSDDFENTSDQLTRIKFGKKTSRAQRQERVTGLLLLESEGGLWPLCLTEGGAILKKNKIVSDKVKGGFGT